MEDKEKIDVLSDALDTALFHIENIRSVYDSVALRAMESDIRKALIKCGIKITFDTEE